MKSHISILLRDLVLEQYTLKFDDINYDEMNNNLGLGTYITTLSQQFKMLTSMMLRFLTDKVYSLEDTYYCRLLAEYIHIIMRYGLGYIIVDIANQLSFVYRGLALELRAFITLPTNTTKTTNFILAVEEKQEL